VKISGASYKNDARGAWATRRWLPLLVGLIVLANVVAGFVRFAASYSPYQDSDPALTVQVNAHLQSRLNSLGVTEMSWMSCSLADAATTGSEITAGGLQYGFNDWDKFTAGHCDVVSQLVNDTSPWAYHVSRQADGSFALTATRLDRGIDFNEEEAMIVASANSTLDQLAAEIDTERKSAEDRAAAKRTWGDAERLVASKG
jgi:hypothetical protein